MSDRVFNAVFGTIHVISFATIGGLTIFSVVTLWLMLPRCAPCGGPEIAFILSTVVLTFVALPIVAFCVLAGAAPFYRSSTERREE
jgi:hypothetical protein